jgi:hypothetical protein
MRRLLAILAIVSVVGLSQPGSPAQVKPGDLKDYNDAMKALRSTQAPDRAAGLSFLALLGGEAKASSREVVAALFDKDLDVRKWAGTALEKVNPEIATPVLSLARGTDYTTRLASLEALAKLGSGADAAVPALRVFLAQAEPTDRSKVVKALAAVGTKDPTVAELFATLALRDNDAAVRTAALQGLSKQESPRGAVDFLATVLANPDTPPAQRAAAITVLADVGKVNPLTVKLLEEQTRNNESPAVRAAVKQALDRIEAAKKAKKQ